MKNQKLTYILLPLAILIWGIIIWKIFFAKVKQAKYVNTVPDVNVESIILDKEKAVKEFSFNYADPFLKTNRVAVISEVDNNAPKRNLNRVVRWPNVQYKEMVSSKKNNTKLGMLKIGNKDYLVRKGQEKERVTVVEISPDSIGLKYESDQRYFLIEGKVNTNLQNRR